MGTGNKIWLLILTLKKNQICASENSEDKLMGQTKEIM